MSCPDPTPRPGDSSYVPPQQLTPGGPVHGGFRFYDTTPMERVLADVREERRRQVDKWGEQNHPIRWPSHNRRDREMYEAQANAWKRINAERVRLANAAGATPDRNCSWDGIAFEELCEALAEGDPAKVRAEAVQATAVLVAMIECIDRTGWSS